MKLIKPFALTSLLFLLALVISPTAQAQLNIGYVEGGVAPGLQASPNTVTAEFMYYVNNDQIHIIDISVGPVQNWFWDMDDGYTKSGIPYFTHTFKETGKYKVCLVVVGPVNTDKKCHKVYIYN